MNRIVSVILAFIVAVLVASIAASIFSTQFVVAGLQNVGVELPLSMRLGMTLGDLSILQSLGLVIAAGFLISFLIAALAYRTFGGNRQFWYVLAGAGAILAALLIMSAIMQLMPVAGARTLFGLITQSLAGALGGYTFARLSNPNKSTEASYA